MANRPRGYGMTADIKAKMAAKYDPDSEQEARIWIEAVVGEPICEGVSSDEYLGSQRMHEGLKDGIILSKLANRLAGSEKIKIKPSKMAFKQMEQIGQFLTYCEGYGLAKTDLFQTVDLYENQNMAQVVMCIHALGRKAQAHGFQGPVLGPKEASKNVREFSEDQMKAGQNVIGLQMGTNKVASQAGQSFGKSRGIMGTDK